MHSILTLADLGDPISQFWLSLFGLIVGVLAIVISIIIAVRATQRKQLTYEVVSNTSVVNSNNDIGEKIELLLEGRLVTNVRLYLIKVLNTGNIAITGHIPEKLNSSGNIIPANDGDYAPCPYFEFTSPHYPQPVVRAAIHLTGKEKFLDPDSSKRPKQLQDMVEINEEKSVVTLRPPVLNPRQAIYLRVLLEADGVDTTTITAHGQIIGGDEIKQYSPPPTPLTVRSVVTGVVVAFVLGLVISNSIGLLTAFAQGSCSIGSIQVSGSTSFYRTALLEAQRYNASCPGQIAHINVSESSSGPGMTDLENGTIQIANSELPSPYADLVDNQAAVIVFALVLNKQVTNASNLTTAQIQKIYSGAVTFWDQVDPTFPHLPIRIIGRVASSGTHAAFVKYVLHGSEPSLPPSAAIVASSTEVVSTVAITPGAIGYADLGDADPSKVTILDIDQDAPTPSLVERGAYPFWAIENMYTRGNPDALTSSFIQYVKRDLQTSDTFIPLSAMGDGVLAAHT